MLNNMLKLIFLSVILTSCSTYPGKFKSAEAKGFWGTMVRDNDIKIDSGEIESVYKTKKKSCKNCSKDPTDILEPAETSKSKVNISDKKPEILDDNTISF